MSTVLNKWHKAWTLSVIYDPNKTICRSTDVDFLYFLLNIFQKSENSIQRLSILNSIFFREQKRENSIRDAERWINCMIQIYSWSIDDGHSIGAEWLYVIVGGSMQNVHVCRLFQLSVGMLAKLGNIILAILRFLEWFWPFLDSKSNFGQFEILVICYFVPDWLSAEQASVLGVAIAKKKICNNNNKILMVEDRSASWSVLFVSTCQLGGNNIQEESSTCWGPECQWERLQLQIHVYSTLFSSSEEYLLLLWKISIALLRRISVAPLKNIYCSSSS